MASVRELKGELQRRNLDTRGSNPAILAARLQRSFELELGTQATRGQRLTRAKTRTARCGSAFAMSTNLPLSAQAAKPGRVFNFPSAPARSCGGGSANADAVFTFGMDENGGPAAAPDQKKLSRREQLELYRRQKAAACAIMRASGILHELVATNALALRALLGGPGGSQLCKFFLSA